MRIRSLVTILYSLFLGFSQAFCSVTDFVSALSKATQRPNQTAGGFWVLLARPPLTSRFQTFINLHPPEPLILTLWDLDLFSLFFLLLFFFWRKIEFLTPIVSGKMVLEGNPAFQFPKTVHFNHFEVGSKIKFCLYHRWNNNKKFYNWNKHLYKIITKVTVVLDRVNLIILA